MYKHLHKNVLTFVRNGYPNEIDTKIWLPISFKIFKFFSFKHFTIKNELVQMLVIICLYTETTCINIYNAQISHQW